MKCKNEKKEKAKSMKEQQPNKLKNAKAITNMYVNSEVRT